MKTEKILKEWQLAGVDAHVLRAFLDSHEHRIASYTYAHPYSANLIGIDADGDLASTSAVMTVERRKDEEIYARTASGSVYRLSDNDILCRRYAIGVTEFSVVPSSFVRSKDTIDYDALARNAEHQEMQEKINDIILKTTSFGSHARIDFPVNSWAIVFRISEKVSGLPTWLKSANDARWSRRVIRGVSHIERLTADSIRVCMGDNIFWFGEADNYDTLTRKASSPVYVDEYCTCRATPYRR